MSSPLTSKSDEHMKPLVYYSEVHFYVMEHNYKLRVVFYWNMFEM